MGVYIDPKGYPTFENVISLGREVIELLERFPSDYAMPNVCDNECIQVLIVVFSELFIFSGQCGGYASTLTRTTTTLERQA